ncbi:MAG: glycoside hydrolase family 88 protein [bacterium]|nr:glycoside hydrolase family 88 protein [bacterium]
MKNRLLNHSLFVATTLAFILTACVAMLKPISLALLSKADSTEAVESCNTSFFTINNPAGHTFIKSCLQNNNTIYSTDNRFLFFLPSSKYNNAAYIKTPNSEIKEDRALRWSVVLNIASTIYIMPRHIPGAIPPAWIHNNYTRLTNDNLADLTQFTKRKNELGLIGLYDIYSKTVPAGTINFQGASDAQSLGYSMYLIALVPNNPATPPPTISVTPSPTIKVTPSPTPSPSPTNSPSPTPSPSAPLDPFDALIESNLQHAVQQYESTVQTVAKTAYPVRTDPNGAWITTSASSWTSGFFPGTLWYLYDYTKNPIWSTRAQQWQSGIESQKVDTSTHDLGFMLFNSYGNGYKLQSNESHKQVVLTAANSLSQRYSPVVGAMRSWNSSNFTVIIDNIMNIEMLFWAAKNGGGQHLHTMAVSHALKTAQNHVRPDGGTYHVVDYNQTTGAVIRQYTHQGYSDTSTWSRGQAWAIYGFTMAYRETLDERFLITARKVADYYLIRLPTDFVPPWDFQAQGVIPRDSSAAAIAASGLLELSKFEVDPTRKTRYQNSARYMITTLSSPAYSTKGTTNKSLLLHGTQNKPTGNYDTGLIFGDYYYVEALLRYRSWFSSRN